ncbi:MAG: ABC transporter ATP-binding protein [Candidatus Thorarchaeota archaeon]|jgi:ABC-type lipoprotein export system ATPase subunit
MSDEPLLGAEEAHEDIEDIDVEGLDVVRHAVKLVDVSRRYTLGKREIEAVKSTNLEVNSGDLIVVSGHSGSGKTTLLNIIGAIDYTTEGRVTVMDVPIGDYDEDFRATFRLSNTGFIFQSYNLISTLTAIENVMFPMQISERELTQIRTEARKLLERVEMSERENHLPWQLSSGEQQRVAIARALANDPPIILADEPTANLDSETGQMIRELLKELNDRGKTIIVMTHDERIIALPNARRYTMDKGVLRSDE